jgi:hypothetical protein
MVQIRPVQYFHATVRTTVGGEFGTLSQLADERVNLLAFSAVPCGPTHTQLVLFPEEPDRLLKAAERISITLTGPQHAILIQGEDRLGILARIHSRLFEARVEVYASMAVSDGRGRYGYILYMRPEAVDSAMQALTKLRDEG